VKRTEYFINGTGPNHEKLDEDPEASPEVQPDASPSPGEIPETVETPPPLPSPSPRKPVVPESRLEGTITLDIDPSTNLIAVESCPVIRTKTFVLGTEPKKYCGPEYHKGRAGDPAGRPRTVGTPQP